MSVALNDPPPPKRDQHPKRCRATVSGGRCDRPQGHAGFHRNMDNAWWPRRIKR